MPQALKGVLFLDRDGVLNEMVVDPEHGTIDSPLHPSQVQVLPNTPVLLKQLQDLGYGLVIVTNQPAAAKGKTTRENLEQVHERVVELVQRSGAQILCSEICFHRSEDRCSCRKPKIGLLTAAWKRIEGATRFDPRNRWMIGDGITDVQAGRAYGIKTAFLGPKKSDIAGVLENNYATPDIWCESLADFTEFLKNQT